MMTKNQATVAISIVAALACLGLWSTCSKARAQDPPAEAPSVDATSILNSFGPPADAGQVATDAGLGGDSTGASGSGESQSGASTPDDQLERIEPFASDWLTVQYEVDNRKDQRVLSFEGHSRVAERVDVYGLLELMSSLDQDPARYSLRAGGFYNAERGPYGAALWYEDFTGSWNDLARFGAFWDVSAGGTEPFCRLIALPVSTDSGGAMARAMFNVALRPRWTIGGFVETSWWGDGGTWTACEPELRYTLRKGLWATLEYRRDERWKDEEDGLALGLKAAL